MKIAEKFMITVKQMDIKIAGNLRNCPAVTLKMMIPLKQENASGHCMQMKNLEDYQKAACIEFLIALLEEKDTSEAYKALQ